MKAIAAAIGQMSQADIARFEQDGTFQVEGYDLVAEDVEILTEDMPGWLVATEGILTIALDIELTTELIEEGLARELINRIQNMRKSGGLEIVDRIHVQIQKLPELEGVVAHFGEYIASQVLAKQICLVDNVADATQVEIDALVVNISIKKA